MRRNCRQPVWPVPVRGSAVALSAVTSGGGGELELRLTVSLLLQRVRRGHLHHQLPRSLSVRGGELQGQHHRGGEPQAAAEDPPGELCSTTIHTSGREHNHLPYQDSLP